MEKSYPTYRCPKYGGDSVSIYAKIAKYRHEGCDFHIFRKICGIFLSEDNIRDLITSGRTPILKGLTSKAGKKFNACLVLKVNCTTTFEFEQKRENESDFPLIEHLYYGIQQERSIASQYGSHPCGSVLRKRT